MSTTNHSADTDVICVNCGKRIEWWICTTPQGPMHRSCFDLFYAIVPTYLPISGCFDKFVVKTKFTLDHYLLNASREDNQKKDVEVRHE